MLLKIFFFHEHVVLRFVSHDHFFLFAFRVNRHWPVVCLVLVDRSRARYSFKKDFLFLHILMLRISGPYLPKISVQALTPD